MARGSRSDCTNEPPKAGSGRSQSEPMVGLRPRASRTRVSTANLEGRLEEIRIEYNQRAEGGVAPSENKQAYVKREIYRLVRSYGRQGRGRLDIQTLVRRDENEPRTPTFEDNPFHWALLAFDPSQSDVARQPTLRRIANQLLHADRHHVPEPLLIGFLYQIGAPDELYQKVRRDQREPWFRSYARSVQSGRAFRSVTAVAEPNPV